MSQQIKIKQLQANSAGSIIFSGATGSLTEDNANLFWDASNIRLGIGTDAPVASNHIISITEQIRIGYDDSNYFSAIVDSSSNVVFEAFGTTPTFKFNNSVDLADGSVAVTQVTGDSTTKIATDEFVQSALLSAWPYYSVEPTTIITVGPKQQYSIFGDFTIEAGTVFNNSGKISIINGSLIEDGLLINSGQIDYYNFASTADLENERLYYHITSVKNIKVEDNVEYLVYGDLKVDGNLELKPGSKLVIINGSIDLSGGGTVTNNGDIQLISLATSAQLAAIDLQSVTDVGNTTTNDIEITDSTKGIILTSPNSSRWRVTVDNFGALITTAI